ncbi:helix-turn-helix domain-containing protein [Rhodobacteraceae bacterium 63075]|nr:helix-turn-helix domain-containing protein [Rhodobacteraceae bacterium 63075]
MHKWTFSPETPRRIALLLFDQFSNLCLANCLEPLRAANTLTGKAGYDWQILTPDGAACRSSSGIEVLPHAALGEMGQVDYLFVLASYHHERHDTPQTRQRLGDAARKAEVVIGLDAAPWLLASAGVLQGRRATIHWDLLDAFTERFLDIEVARARVLRDGACWTCAGAMSALDLTLELIAETLGIATRLDVEALFLHGDPPLGREEMLGDDPLVRRALSLMRDTVERPLSLAALASALSCQPRTLDRRCRARLGAPPGRVYRHLRLSAARKLLEDGGLPVAEVALRSGYENPAALARALRKHYGASPSELRRKARG